MEKEKLFRTVVMNKSPEAVLGNTPYLSLDGLDLILKTGDHAVQLSNFSLGCAKVITVLSSRALHLLILLCKIQHHILFVVDGEKSQI